MHSELWQPRFADLREGRQTELSRAELAENFPDGLVLALGNFDGIHLGHRKLIETAAESAATLRREGKKVLSGIWCFSDSPADHLFDDPPPHICSTEEKLSLAARYGAEIAVIADFETLRNLSAQDFVQYIEGECLCHSVVCGFNFRFGKNGCGNPAFLQNAFGQSASVVDAVTTEDGAAISSSRIRQLLLSGQIEEANRLLGHRFAVSGKVTHGKALGRKMGLPTLNLDFFPRALIPKTGIYASVCRIGDKSYPAVTNIGSRPTVEKNAKINCETHILDFDSDLYGEHIEIELCKKLRDERRFDTVEELQMAIENDVINSRNYFAGISAEEDRI